MLIDLEYAQVWRLSGPLSVTGFLWLSQGEHSISLLSGSLKEADLTWVPSVTNLSSCVILKFFICSQCPGCQPYHTWNICPLSFPLDFITAKIRQFSFCPLQTSIAKGWLHLIWPLHYTQPLKNSYSGCLPGPTPLWKSFFFASVDSVGPLKIDSAPSYSNFPQSSLENLTFINHNNLTPWPSSSQLLGWWRV